MTEQIIQIKSAPGIKRDGTRLEGDNYVDGQWVRFQRGLPRKIGGYRSINKYISGVVRAVHEYTQDLLTYLHLGSAEKVERLYIDGSYNTSVVTDRTPTSGFTVSANNMWQFAVAYDTTNGNQLVAQVAPNLECICNSTGGEIFTGDLLGTGVLVEVPGANKPANFSATGGVVSLPPYTFVYGNDGYVAWSVPNTPDDFVGSGAGNAYVTGQKIIKGMPLRGGPGNSPSGLFWSADSLVRASYVGSTQIFQFDTISTQTSIMSANCVIEYDGIFYWIGTDRFLMFNGVVREMENNLNLNFFFDNLNTQYRQKVFAIKVPRFGEIWWCFPFGDSTEPNHAIIYNVRENTWYDTALPEGGRGAGTFPAVFRKPLMTGVEQQDYRAVTVAVDGAGTGYTAGDVLTVAGGIGLIPVEVTVTTVNGSGGVTGVSLSNAGQYTETPANPASVTGGTGSAATLTVTFERPYKLWVHEVGTDAIDGQSVQPIQSYFETGDISLPALSGQNRAMQVLMVEPDFVQSGDMILQVRGRANARAPEVNGDVMTFPDTASTPQEQVVFLKTQRRELRFHFESNTVGGDYQMGQVFAHVQPGDGTTLG
jgi:hypothetical protein